VILLILYVDIGKDNIPCILFNLFIVKPGQLF